MTTTSNFSDKAIQNAQATKNKTYHTTGTTIFFSEYVMVTKVMKNK
jgi:hypothetical protein